MARTRQLHLDESTLINSAISGKNRFRLSSHRTAPGVVAEAQVITITIDGECRVMKSTNHATAAEIVGGTSDQALAPPALVIHPAANGGFVMHEHSRDPVGLHRIIAACSDLQDLLASVGQFYAREAVIVHDAEEDPSKADGDETAPAPSEPSSADDLYYVVVSGTGLDPHKNVTIFYSEDAMMRTLELIWAAGGRAWARPSRIV